MRVIHDGIRVLARVPNDAAELQTRYQVISGSEEQCAAQVAALGLASKGAAAPVVAVSEPAPSPAPQPALVVRGRVVGAEMTPCLPSPRELVQHRVTFPAPMPDSRYVVHLTGLRPVPCSFVVMHKDADGFGVLILAQIYLPRKTDFEFSAQYDPNLPAWCDYDPSCATKDAISAASGQGYSGTPEQSFAAQCASGDSSEGN